MHPSRPYCLVATLLTVLAGHASSQVVPRIVIDTSARMAMDLNGVPTFGDGVTDHCTVLPDGELCGTGCSAGLDTDCDGVVNDSVIQIVKETVGQQILESVDVHWALARLSQIQDRNISCNAVNGFECNASGPVVTSYGNPQCNSHRIIPKIVDCPWDLAGLIPIECRPGTEGRPPLFTRIGGDPRVCINYAGVCARGGAGGDVLVDFPNLGDFIVRNNGPTLVSWLDGTETFFVDSLETGHYCDSAVTGDCKLRPSGPRPLAGALNAVHDWLAPIRADDLCGGCRPYAVLLVTRGSETCGGDPAAAAATLALRGILTYVVGVGVHAAFTRSQLNAIAEAGQTSAGVPSGDNAFFADDRLELSAAIAEIAQRLLGGEPCPDPAVCGAICGDADDDGVVRDSDVTALRAYLADSIGAPLPDAGLGRCSVIGVSDPCDLLDVVVLRRALALPPLAPGIQQVCKARMAG
ncbi:MAG: hypothetical protein ACE5FG_03680 [Myxococcota bacterium]